MKILFLIMSILFSNSLFSQRNEEYKSWQINLGIAASKTIQTWDVGVAKYHNDDRKIFKYGLDLGYYQNKSNRKVDFTKKYDSIALSTGKIYDRFTEYSADYFFRIKPFTSVGYKIIKRKKYSSDITLDLGMGLNIWRKYVQHFYDLNSGGYPIQPLIIESNINKKYSYFNRPDIFIGLRNSHYFKISKSNEIFFDFLVGYDWTLFLTNNQSYYNGIYLQIKLGISLRS